MARFIKSGRGRGLEKAPDFSGRVAPARLERERGTEFLRGTDEESGEARSGCKGKHCDLATRRSAEQRERGRGGAKIQARERARRGNARAGCSQQKALGLFSPCASSEQSAERKAEGNTNAEQRFGARIHKHLITLR